MWIGILNLGIRVAHFWRAALVLALVLFGTNAPLTYATRPFSWEAPELTDPITIRLTTGPTFNSLVRDRDYIIQLPRETKVGHTMIDGGRNIVIQGGHVTIPADGETDVERRGIYIKNATGVVHIEGVRIDGNNQRGFDGIAISAPRATVQIVNVRVDGVTGRFSGYHGDIVQPFGGVRELRIDHLSGTSSYQGFYLAETSGPIGSVDIRNVNLEYNPNEYDSTTYLLWLPVDSRTCAMSYPVSLQNVYISSRPGQDVVGFAVWPNDHHPDDCTSSQDGDTVSWPALSAIHGGVTVGPPPDGDFVPVGSVGNTDDKFLPTPTPIAFPVPPLGKPAQRAHSPGRR